MEYIDDAVFIVDLNSLDDDDLLSISTDFTANLGPHVRSSRIPTPKVGSEVSVHSEDDDLYLATVIRAGKVANRDFVVAIDWKSRTPVLNPAWSARDVPLMTVSYDAKVNSGQ